MQAALVPSSHALSTTGIKSHLYSRKIVRRPSESTGGDHHERTIVRRGVGEAETRRL